MRSIVLIADDFGLSPAVDAGILELAECGRLSGFGCLTQLPRWFDSAKALDQVPIGAGGVQVGLHLNLSQGFGGAWHQSLPVLITGAYAGLLPRDHIRDSLRTQWDRFTQALGRVPDYVDGHQHVHQLPVVRDCLLDLLAEEAARPWVRITAPIMAPKPAIKGWMIAHLGAETLRQLAQRQGLKTNAAFAGVYGFDQSQNGYAHLMGEWLSAAPENTVIMCHPGHFANVSPDDPIAPARAEELGFLSSPEFDDLLSAHDCRIAQPAF
ncbi:ChbG/HpnK family deacetylase [Halothiobacillus sp.]|uniref:ChbG/HpnK family deacetylase n=1 Tax=Halothiobacillus sp. TaxID=1891311 RepID=UPI0026301D65|nr:ChbG/HpnK family deacetylase [Halothiobacillus sp.]MDD4967183.1 ChbG/HpnK family deacetylase [Halothiobacillus sp.]